VIAEVGTTSRNGRYQIAEKSWDHNGTLTVTVRMTSGMLHTEADIRAMRRLARRAIMYPEKTRSARLIRVWIAGDTFHAAFAVSRLAS
jgi:hypothetical protein